MRKLIRAMICGGAMAIGFGMPTFAQAQGESVSSATQMWGTATAQCGCSAAVESAMLHYEGGLIAGQVNAAKKGLLINNGSNTTIQAIGSQSIGSQSIVSTTILGSHNQVNTLANQTTTNGGDVQTNGSIGFVDGK